MKIDDLLNKLGQYYGLPELLLDKNNVCNLMFDGGHDIFIEPDTLKQNSHLYAVVGLIPSYEKELFYEKIFDKNLFGKETGDALIHCDVKRNEVLLYRTINHNVLDTQNFISLIENFVHCVIDQQFWMKNVLVSDQPYKSTESVKDKSNYDTDVNFIRV